MKKYLAIIFAVAATGAAGFFIGEEYGIRAVEDHYSIERWYYYALKEDFQNLTEEEIDKILAHNIETSLNFMQELELKILFEALFAERILKSSEEEPPESPVAIARKKLEEFRNRYDEGFLDVGEWNRVADALYDRLPEQDANKAR